MFKSKSAFNGSKAIFSGALLINIGRQMIFGDFVTCDIGIGLGYVGTSEDNSEMRTRYYSHSSSGGPFAMSFAFSMGVLLKYFGFKCDKLVFADLLHHVAISNRHENH